MKKFVVTICAIAIGLAGYGAGRWHAEVKREPNQHPAGVSMLQERHTARETRLWRGQQKVIGTADELLAALDACDSDDSSRRTLVRAVSLLDRDGLKAMANSLLVSSHESGYRLRALREVVGQWSEQDAKQALAWAQQLPPADDQKDDIRKYVLATIVGELAATDGALALHLALSKLDGGSVLDGIFSKWAKQDRSAALAAALDLAGQDRSRAFCNVFDQWGGIDPAGAIAATSQLSRQERPGFQARILSSWADRDPVAAAAWLNTLATDEQDKVQRCGGCVERMLENATKQDPALGLKLLSELPPPVRSRNLGDFAKAWGNKDLSAAWAWAQGLSSPAERNDAMVSLGISASSAEPDEILRLAGQFTAERGSGEFLDNCCDTLSYADPAKLAALVRKMSPAQHKALNNKDSILRQIKENSPKVVVAELLTSLPGFASQDMWSEFVGSYASDNPMEAYEWLKALPEHADQLPKVIRELGHRNPSDALAKAQLLEDHEARRQITEQVLSNWRSADSDGFQKAFESMSGAIRYAAMNQVLQDKCYADPAAAAAYIQSLQHSARAEDAKVAMSPETFETLASNWGEKQPESAVAWISQVPAGELRQSYIENLAQAWSGQDERRASEWIASLPKGADKDGAVVGLLENISSSDPEAALVWASQIQDAGKREDTYANALEALREKDPAALPAAVDAAPISAGRKRALLEHR